MRTAPIPIPKNVGKEVPASGSAAGVGVGIGVLVATGVAVGVATPPIEGELVGVGLFVFVDNVNERLQDGGVWVGVGEGVCS